MDRWTYPSWVNNFPSRVGALSPSSLSQVCVQYLLWLLLLVAVTGNELLIRDACAGPEAAEEYAVKAAYLYNFAKFVEWPQQTFATPTSPIILCILGSDPFGDSLDKIAERTVGERPVAIRRLARVEESNGCHVLFLSRSESTRLQSILNELAPAPILTVSDIPGFADAGGMIGLVSVGQRIRFEINLRAATRAKLKISSQLLKLARVIGDSEGN